MKWEEQLEARVADIQWSKTEKHRTGGFIRESGFLTVPASYFSPSKGTIKVHIYRYRVPDKVPDCHVILLSGGPGCYNTGWKKYARERIPSHGGRLAAYIVDHRGLGKSAPFPLPGDLSLQAFLKAASSGSFSIKDLTLENAALDVALLGMTIKKDGLWKPTSRLSIYGGSYGARLAHHTVQLAPTTFKSVLLGSVPKLRGITSRRHMLGLAEVCEADEFCRSKMGNDVYSFMKDAARKLANENHNSCTKLFHEQVEWGPLDFATNIGEKVASIGQKFRLIIRGDVPDYPNSPDFRSAQILLPFLKATMECKDPTEYRQKVLIPMMKAVNSKGSAILTWKGLKLNPTVYGAIALDARVQDFRVIRPTPPDNAELHYADDPMTMIGFSVLMGLLKDRRLSAERPLVSPVTEVYVLHGKMDFVTTYEPAWELFNKMKTPFKLWSLSDHDGHNGGISRCDQRIEKFAYYGEKLDEKDHEPWVRKRDMAGKPSWKFEKYPDFARMWDCVSNSSSTASSVPTKSSVPSFKILHSTGPFVMPEDQFSITWPTVIVGLGLLGIVLYAGITIYRKKRQSRDSTETETEVEIS